MTSGAVGRVDITAGYPPLLDLCRYASAHRRAHYRTQGLLSPPTFPLRSLWVAWREEVG